MKWFRFYGEVLNDPKVQTLPPPIFKAWVNLLCFASQNTPEGELGTVREIAFALRISAKQALQVTQTLLDRGLVESDPLIDHDASWFRIHNWNARQFASDNTTERVRKHRRNVSCNDLVTPPDTDTEQNRTDTEQSVITKPRRKPKPILPPREMGEATLAEPEFMKGIRERFRRLDIGYQAEKWLDYIVDKPPKANYKNSFRNWLEKALQFSGEEKGAEEERRYYTEEELDAEMRADPLWQAHQNRLNSLPSTSKQRLA